MNPFLGFCRSRIETSGLPGKDHIQVNVLNCIWQLLLLNEHGASNAGRAGMLAAGTKLLRLCGN